MRKIHVTQTINRVLDYQILFNYIIISTDLLTLARAKWIHGTLGSISFS